MLFFCFFNYFFENLWEFLSKLGQNLSVNQDIFLLQVMNEFAVRNSEFFARGANLNLPKAPEVPFFDFSVAVRVFPGVHYRFFSGPEF